MNGEVYAVVQQRVIDLLCEERPAADPGERNVRSEIARRLDFDAICGMAPCREQRAHSLRLPKSQSAAAGTDPKRRVPLTQPCPVAGMPRSGACPAAAMSSMPRKSATLPAALSAEAIASPSDTPSR